MILFDHQGCYSGQCAFQQAIMAQIAADDVSNENNHVEMKRKARELFDLARKLLIERDGHYNVVYPEAKRDAEPLRKATGAEGFSEAREGEGNG